MVRRKNPRRDRIAGGDDPRPGRSGQAKKPRAKSRTNVSDRLETSNNEVYALETDEYDRHIGFCCAKCTCSEERKDMYSTDMFVIDCEARISHRRCCHFTPASHDVQFDPSCTPSRAIRSGVVKKLIGKMDPDNPPPFDNFQEDPDLEHVEEVDDLVLDNWYQQAKKREAGYNNNGENVDENFLLQTHEGYNKNRQNFVLEKWKRKDIKEPAVVLDLFSGIGGAVVALKRAKIDIKRVRIANGENFCISLIILSLCFFPHSFVAAHPCRARQGSQLCL
jgi:hypothetical protein